jgi:hypothetical protein
VSTFGPSISRICCSFESLRLRSTETCVLVLALIGAISVLGCQGIKPAGSFSGIQNAAISGSVHGGQQPISGASIQLYAASDAGDGSAATALLTSQMTTDSSGRFNLTALPQCPTASSEVYLVSIGGNPGLLSGQTNAQIALLAVLGPCGNLTAATSVEINEVTTVAAAYALAPYMQSYGSIGSNPSDAQMMVDAFTMTTELANSGSGSSPGLGVPIGQVVPSQKLNTLANVLSHCINSSGGKAGDSSPCGLLFSLVSAAISNAPTDTVGALLDIAQNPTNNVVPIFDLNPPRAPFQPSLSAAPADWTLGITSPTPVPVFSPAPGTYAVSPSIALADTNPTADIYYTIDGSTPTSSSIPYVGAFALSGTTTVRAVAIASGISSTLVSTTYTVSIGSPSPWVPPVNSTLVFLTAPVNATSGLVLTPGLQVALEDPLGNVYTAFTGQVTLALAANPTNAVLSGTLSATAVNGVATFSNIIVTLSGSGYQLAASNPQTRSGVSASFTVGAPLHLVDLSWSAPISSPDPVAGYHVYRSSDGGNTYQLLNSAVNTGTTYEDTIVQSGQSYEYYVTSVDSSGVESAPSNTIDVTIP